MYVLDVIPFSKGAPPGALSYRSTKKLEPGTLVSAPLRKRRVRGLVVSVLDAIEAKAALKTASFMLSGDIEELGMLPPSIVEAIRKTARYHATQLGAAFSQLLETVLTEDLPGTLASGPGFSLSRVEGPRTTRMETYRSLIEKTEGATLLVVPTLAEAASVKDAFKDLHPVVLSGAVPPAKRAALLQKAQGSMGLVIATPSFSYVLIQNLGQVVIDRVSAGAYRFQKRPYLDAVRALHALAEARAIPLSLGDFPLPLEYRNEEVLSARGLGTIRVFDAKEKDGEERTEFRAVPDPLRAEIKKALDIGGRIAVLAARRGYSPAVVCRTCSASVRDKEGRALSLASEGGERVLRSSDGKTLKDADAVCDVCGSWNLLPLGVGVERVCEELQEAFPDARLIRFDTDTIRTPLQARKAAKELEEPGTIAVGTEFLLPWLSGGLDLACVASADSLLALPFWRSRERFLRLLMTLRENAKETIVATRRMDDTALGTALDPEEGSFFEEERSLRKILGYPPYGTLLSLVSQGTHAQLDALDVEIGRIAGDHTRTRLPNRGIGDGKYRGSWILMLSEGAWPNEELSERLSQLPPSVRVLLDPDSL